MLDLAISDDGVATLALDRPDVLNALGTPMIEALLEALEVVGEVSAPGFKLAVGDFHQASLPSGGRLAQA